MAYAASITTQQYTMNVESSMATVPYMLFGGSGVFCEGMSVAVTSDWFEPWMLILSFKSKGPLIPVEDVRET
jgi:hypothetical protein